MSAPAPNLQRTLAEAFAEAVVRAALSTPDLAQRAGLPPERVTAILAGEFPVPWAAIDVLAHVLTAPEEAPRVAHLHLLRSRLEAPDLGLPGSFCLCVGDAGGHLVRRAPGQLFCSEHGLRLMGHCPHCEESLRGLCESSLFCPACGELLVARRRARRAPQSCEVTTVRRTLAVFSAPSRLDPRDLPGPVATAGDPRTGARGLAEPDADDLQLADELRRHNAALGLQGPGQLSPRAAVHYRAAQALHAAGGGRPFTRRQLRDAWADFAHDGRSAPIGSILPRTFCPGDGKSAAAMPWFLRSCGRGAYVFVGLDGRGDLSGASMPVVARPAAAPSRAGELAAGHSRTLVTRLPRGVRSVTS